MNKHIEMEQLISAYHDGEVTPRQKAEVEEHLKVCASCRTYQKQLQKISSSLAAWNDQDLSPDSEQKIANRIFQKGSGSMNRVQQGMRISAVLVVVMAAGIYVIQMVTQRSLQGRLRNASDYVDSSPTSLPAWTKQSEPVGPLASLKEKVDQFTSGEKRPDGLASRESEKMDLAKTRDTFTAGVTNSVLVGPETTDMKMNMQIASPAKQEYGFQSSSDGQQREEYEPYSLQSDYTVKQDFNGPMEGAKVKALTDKEASQLAYYRGKGIAARGVDELSELPSQPVSGYLIKDMDRVDPYGRSYPPTSNNERYESSTENAFLNVLSEPLSTFSIDVDTASYANIRRFINSGQLPPPDAVRIEEMINYFNYDFPQPQDEHPFEIVTEVGPSPWNPQHPLVMVGLQGKNIAMEELPPSNLVFLIDVSGSMNEPNKLPLLKSSFQLLVEQLRPNDHVAIVVYAGNAGLVLDSTSGRDKERIMQAIDQLSAGGSTAGGAGIELAYRIAQQNFKKEGNNRVILATDGDFNVGVSSDDELVRIIEEKRSHGVFLSVLGFGSGNLQDAKMEKLADKGNGNYSYIDNILEGEKVFVHELGGTLFTIAKDVKIQIEFNPAQVKAYRLLGYENRMLAKEDFNNDFKDAGELGSGHQVTAFYELIPAGSNESTGGVDPLKYQAVEESGKKPSSVIASHDLLTVKLRYKKPEEDRSRLIERTLGMKDVDLAELSDNFRFAAAVAEAGLLLKNSHYQAQASFAQVLSLAQSSTGRDLEGYRSEFIKLMRMVQLLREGRSIR